MTWLVAVVVAASPTAAHLVLTPEGGKVADRAQLAARYQLVTEEAVRAVLEHTQRVVAPEELAREAQRAIVGPLRRFDLVASRTALDRAWAAMREVRPGPEGRALVLELCTVQAQLAVLLDDAALLAQAAAISLSVDPTWVPDERVAPAVRARLTEERERVRRAPFVRREVVVHPASARLDVQGQALPAAAWLSPEAAAVVWVTAPGYAPRLLKLEALTAEVTLSPETPAQRLAPLVAAVRAASGAARTPAAIAVARALQVELVLLDEGGAITEVAAREPPVVREQKAWLADGLGVGFAITSAVLLGASVTLFAVGERAALEASRAPTLGDYEADSNRARDTRALGAGLAIGAAAALTVAVIRYVVVVNLLHLGLSSSTPAKAFLLEGRF